MSMFERLGLAPKRLRPVGRMLEKGSEDLKRARRKNLSVKAGIFLSLLVLTMAAFPRGELYRYTVEVGDEWRRETLVAPFGFAIYKDSDEIAREREQVRFTTPPFFAEDESVRNTVRANRDTVDDQLVQIFDAYVSMLTNQSRGRRAEAAQDSSRYVGLRERALPKLTEPQWVSLAQDYADRVPGVTTFSRQRLSGPRLYEQLLDAALDFSLQMLSQGVLDVPIDSIYTDEIMVRNEAISSERLVPKRALFGINEAFGVAQNQFELDFPGDPEAANITSAFFRAIFSPSLHYQAQLTQETWRQKADGFSPTRGAVLQGEVIVRQEEIITDEILRKLTSLERARAEMTGNQLYWRQALGQFILVLATYLLFFFYLYLLRRNVFDDNSKVFLLALLFAMIIGLFALTVRSGDGLSYLIPLSIVSLLVTVMFDSRVGLFATITLAFLGAHLLGFDFTYAFATIFAGSLVVFSVRDIKNRAQFFVSAGLAFLGYVTVLVGAWLLQHFASPRLFRDLLYVGVNSFLLLLAYPLLWAFERTFNITTELTLLELSDTNRPLLKELSLRAPGTFNHSLQVANLAEAAADAIGANALLTRVGALYHDIGKMVKPEYFVENQRSGLNPHDNLKPRMSALIIAAHVKEGLEMGREYNLPQPVLDFIPMHHGTTRIEYFFRKAEELRRPEEAPVQESEFRYPGPRPNSKETGILMLADSVEAAARTIENPSHKRLESLVEGIINGRIDDKQLGHTDLTFNDLERIKEAFLSILMGIYHVRVRYPGQEGETPTGRLHAHGHEASPASTTVPEAPAVQRDSPTVSVKVPDPHNGDGASNLHPSPQAEGSPEQDMPGHPSP